MRPTKPLPFAQPAKSGGFVRKLVKVGGRKGPCVGWVSRLKQPKETRFFLRHLTLGEAGLVLRKNYHPPQVEKKLPEKSVILPFHEV